MFKFRLTEIIIQWLNNNYPVVSISFGDATGDRFDRIIINSFGTIRIMSCSIMVFQVKWLENPCGMIFTINAADPDFFGKIALVLKLDVGNGLLSCG